MIPAGIPDLLSAGRQGRLLTEVKARFDRASEELTSGRKSDIVAATKGDPSRLYAVERALSTVAQRSVTVDAAIGRSEVAQTALEGLQAATAQIGAKLLAAVELGDMAAAELEASLARGAFTDAVGALNARFGDRTLFAGADADGPALAPAGEILDEIFARIAAAPDAAAAIAAVDDYFADPAGFAATGYLGSTTDAPPTELESGARLDHAVRADRAEIVSALRALALGVVGAEGGFAGAAEGERMKVMDAAARAGIAAVDQVVKVRGELGVSEERLETAKVRLSAENAFLERAKNAIVAKDQFEAANEFTALETQLSLIFEVTARLSGLNLANFLR